MSEARIICGDCLEEMPKLADSSIDAVVTDPPYFRVKADAWDHQWERRSDYLEWMRKVCAQWLRLLKPNGSLYVFASPDVADEIATIVRGSFQVLNSVVWVKDAGWHKKAAVDTLRAFFPQTERIIFAEHKGADSMAMGESGYEAKCERLHGFVFEPLRAYLDGERVRAGVDRVACNLACGFSASPGGMASRHYFSASQWQLPTAEHYEALRRLFNANGGQYLRREYDDLRREYDDLRRPFSVSSDDQYTDVWTFKPVPHRDGKHPCEKPLAMLEHIIRTSTRPGALVLDCFAGSGVTGEACRKLGRDFIGIEKDQKWADAAARRAEIQPPLFVAA